MLPNSLRKLPSSERECECLTSQVVPVIQLSPLLKI